MVHISRAYMIWVYQIAVLTIVSVTEIILAILSTPTFGCLITSFKIAEYYAEEVYNQGFLGDILVLFYCFFKVSSAFDSCACQNKWLFVCRCPNWESDMRNFHATDLYNVKRTTENDPDMAIDVRKVKKAHEKWPERRRQSSTSSGPLHFPFLTGISCPDSDSVERIEAAMNAMPVD